MAATQMWARGPFVYADPVDLEAGQEGEIVVKMDFDTDETVTGVTFTLVLPEGVDLSNPSSPKASCTLPEDLFEDHYYDSHLLAVKKTIDGDYLFVIVDQDEKTPLASTHCELVRIAVKSDVSWTLKPEITKVGIVNDMDMALVIDGKLVNDNSNILYVEDTQARVGTEITLSVKMRNEMDVEGFAFDLILPGGMTFVNDGEGQPMVSLSEERTTAARTNTFNVVKLSNWSTDAVRVVAASSNGSAISAGDGEVCTIRILIGTGLKAGKYSIWLRNMSISDTDAVSYDKDNYTSAIVVYDLDLGDANGDGNVTVADMTAIAHHVLGNTPEGFSPKAADANQDGLVNVADYTAVAHLLLYGSIERPASARSMLTIGLRAGRGAAPAEADIAELENTVYIAPASAIAGEEAVLSVRMKNAVDAEGFQCTLTLPEGVSVVRDAEGFAEATLSTERTTKEGMNTFATSLLPDGTLKVMGASTNGSAITAGDGEVCTVRIKVSADMAEGDYALLLSDVAISDTRAKSHNVEQMETTLTVSEASAISEIVNRKSVNSKSFDLQGRQLSNSKWSDSQIKKGVYIQDGKKYVK